MVLVLKHGCTAEQMQEAIAAMEKGGVKVMISQGAETTILGAEGNAANLDQEFLAQLPGVERVMRVSEPYKKANRKYHPDDSVIDIGGGVLVGGEKLAVIAGPCSVESEEQITAVARDVKGSGACALRGGAYKPRTSPYAFQGLGSQGLELLRAARAATGLPICTELMDLRHLDEFHDIDIIQIGARNMQNFDLLKEVGKTDKPILLKRGLSSTIQEWLMSAEYIMSEGNEKIILCERGIRTYETATRNTLDLSCVPILHELTHLPVVVDPSHATGKAKLVSPMAVAATAAGADGLMIEVHNDPAHALCDGAQSLTPEQFAALAQKVGTIREAMV